MSLFSDIPTRVNGQIIESSFFETIKTKLELAFGDENISDDVLWEPVTTDLGVIPIPKMNETQRDALTVSAALEGLGIWNTTTSKANFYDGSTWVEIGDSADLSLYVTLAGNETISGDKTHTGIIDITNTTESTTDDTGALIVDGGLGVKKNVNISGNLTVAGTTTQVGTVFDAEDPNLTVNKGGNDASSEGGGLTVERTGTDGKILYEDALASKFKIGASGSESEIVTAGATQTIAGTKTYSSPDIDTPTIDVQTLEEQSGTPSTPSPGEMKLYAKDDKTMYQLDSDGTESLIAGGGGGTSVPSTYQVLNAEEDDTATWAKSGSSTLAINETTPINGTADYKFTVTAVNEKTSSAAYTLQPRQSEALTTHSVKGVYHNASGEFTVRVIDQSDNQIGDEVILDQNTDSTAFEIMVNVPSTVTTIRFEAECITYNSSDILYFDDLVFDDDYMSVKAITVSDSCRLHTPNGYGSTNNKIARLSNIACQIDNEYSFAAISSSQISTNGLFAVSDSSTDGTYITINRSGEYTIGASGYLSIASNIGLSLNSTQLTTSITAITPADKLILGTSSSGGFTEAISWRGNLKSGDILRFHTDGTAFTAGDRTTFYISGSADADHVVRGEDRQQAHFVGKAIYDLSSGYTTTSASYVLPSLTLNSSTLSGDLVQNTANAPSVTIPNAKAGEYIVRVTSMLGSTASQYMWFAVYDGSSYYSEQIIYAAYTPVVVFTIDHLSEGDLDIDFVMKTDAGNTYIDPAPNFEMSISYNPPPEEKTVPTLYALPTSKENNFTAALGTTTDDYSNLTGGSWIDGMALSGTSSQTKTLSIPSGFFSVVPNAVVSVIAAASGTDLTARYDKPASTTTSLVFHVTANGAATNQSISVDVTRGSGDFTPAGVWAGVVAKTRVMYIDVHATNYLDSVAATTSYKTVPLISTSGPDIFGSISSDQLTLPEGEYDISFVAGSYSGSSWIDVLFYNITDTANIEELLQLGGHSTISTVMAGSQVEASVSLTVTKIIEIRTKADAASGTEYYGRIKIVKRK